MKTSLIRVIFFCSAILFCSCEFGLQNLFFRAPQPGERSGTLAQLLPITVTNTNAQIKFFLLTDTHFGSSSQYPMQAITASFVAEDPDFIITLGDTAESGIPSSFEEYENFLTTIHNGSPAIPNFAIVGNHDLYNDGLAAWKRIRANRGGENGETFYKFETTVEDASVPPKKYKRSWYFIDSASSTLGNKQYNALVAAIRSDKNPKLVFSHFPFYAENSSIIDYFKWSNTYERAMLLNLFDKNHVNGFFSGHWHKGGRFKWGNFWELCGGSFRPDQNNINHWYYVTINETAPQHMIIQEYQTVNGDSTTVKKLPPETYNF